MAREEKLPRSFLHPDSCPIRCEASDAPVREKTDRNLAWEEPDDGSEQANVVGFSIGSPRVHAHIGALVRGRARVHAPAP